MSETLPPTPADPAPPPEERQVLVVTLVTGEKLVLRPPTDSVANQALQAFAGAFASNLQAEGVLVPSHAVAMLQVMPESEAALRSLVGMRGR